MEVYFLPSWTGIDQSRQRVDELKAKLERRYKVEVKWMSDSEFRKAKDKISRFCRRSRKRGNG